MKTPALIINELIKDTGLSVSEFARQLPIGRQTIQDILSGKRKKIPKVLFLQLQEKFGISSIWLLTGEGEKYAKADSLSVQETPAGYGKGIVERIDERDQQMSMQMKSPS